MDELTPHTWSLRAVGAPSAAVTVHTGKASIRVGRQAAFEPMDPPTALELFVAALAADVVEGFRSAAARARRPVRNVELALRYWLENPLVHFGVVGEEGSPRLKHVEGTMYVDGDHSRPQVAELWAETLARAPTYSTLAACVRLDLRCETV